MKINNFSPKLNLYKTRAENKKSYLSQTSFVNFHSVSFKGSLAKASVEKVNFWSILKRNKYERYKIWLFNKIKGEKTEAILHCIDSKTYKDGKNLIISDNENNMLGSVILNLSRKGEREKLPKGYARLHLLTNGKREQYSGVGTTLIQASVEKSLSTDSDGKFGVYACSLDDETEPFIFYKKMGLSLLRPGLAKIDLSNYLAKLSEQQRIQLKTNLASRKINDLPPDELMSEIYRAVQDCNTANTTPYMWLNEVKVDDIWRPRIKLNPIFCKANKLN